MKKNMIPLTLPGNYNCGNRLRNHATLELFENPSYKPEALPHPQQALPAHLRYE